MQIVLDYIRGRIPADEFKKEWYTNPSIGEWLDSLVDLKSPLNEKWSNLPYNYLRFAIHKHYDGSCAKFIEASDSFHTQHPNTPKWLDIKWHFDAIAAIIVVAFPEIVPTTYYEEEASFYQNAVGEYLGGPEVEQYIGDILESFPRNMGKTKRLKAAKTELKSRFHISGNQYPRWAQEAEWPMGTQSPMMFVSQKRTGDLVVFTFQDADTGEIRMIEQYN